MSCWNSTLFNQFDGKIRTVTQKALNCQFLRELMDYGNSLLFLSYREVHRMEQATPLLQSTMELLKNAIHTQQQLKQEQSKRYVKIIFYNGFWKKNNCEN